MPTIFAELVWQPLPESCEIDINVFLKDAESLLSLVDIIGSQMKPVRSDMLGNMNKINDSHKKHSPDKKYLHELLEVEFSSGLSKKDPSASVGVLWLKRGIEYFYEFLHIICERLADGTLGESMSEVARQAYDKTLKEHHKWIMVKTFNMMSHLSPKKATLLKNMTQDRPELCDSLPSDIRLFLDSVKPVMAQLNELVNKYEIAK